jgi:predicted nucleic acid-binding protein
VWVDFFNGYDSPEADALARLLADEADLLTCGVIAAEVLQGLRDQSTMGVIERNFIDMEWLTPLEPGTYVAAAELFRSLRRTGITVRSTIDCIIARLAEENDALLLAKDRDMRFIVDSGLSAARVFPPI